MQNNTKDKINNDICNELWHTHESRIRTLCQYKFSNNIDEVDDIVAETYLVLCETVNSGAKIENPRAWLYGIVNNIVKHKYRELNKRKEKQKFISDMTIDLSYDIDFLDEIISDEDIEKMKAEIESELNDSEKELLELVYEKKLTSKQIADMKGSTEAAIKQRRFRLINKIKMMVKEKNKNFL